MGLNPLSHSATRTALTGNGAYSSDVSTRVHRGTRLRHCDLRQLRKDREPEVLGSDAAFLGVEVLFVS